MKTVHAALQPSVLRYHRTLASTLNTLLDAGSALTRIEESVPLQDQIRQTPALEQGLEHPKMPLVSATKMRP